MCVCVDKKLTGGGGADTISGGSGNDVVIGDIGASAVIPNDEGPGGESTIGQLPHSGDHYGFDGDACLIFI